MFRDLDELHAAVDGLHLDLAGDQFGHMSILAPELLGADGVLADAAFLMGGGDLEGVPPLGPGVVRGTVIGRTRDDLELMHALAAVPVDGAQAVGAGVASADDDDTLVLGEELGVVRYLVAGDAAVLQGQEVHREVDALQVPTGDRQVARAQAPPASTTASNSLSRFSAG